MTALHKTTDYQNKLEAMKKLCDKYSPRSYGNVVRIEPDCLVVTNGFALLKLEHDHDTAEATITPQGYDSPVKFPRWKSVFPHGSYEAMSIEAANELITQLNRLVKGINKNGQETLIVNIDQFNGNISVSPTARANCINFGANWLKYWKTFYQHITCESDKDIYFKIYDGCFVIEAGESALIASLMGK